MSILISDAVAEAADTNMMPAAASVAKPVSMRGMNVLLFGYEVVTL
jgi:hypothetical protein